MKIIIPLIVITILITGLVLPLDALADVTSPKKQTNLGLKKSDVICKANLFKVIKKSDGMPACVKPESAKKLIAQGWTMVADPTTIDKFIQEIKSRQSVGTVTKVAVVKQTVTPGIAKTPTGVDFYNVIFEVCAKENTIRLPEVIVSSDSETRYVKLVEKLSPNNCEINAAKIKASNTDSITLQLVNKGGVTKKLNELESKVNMLTEEINAEKSQLSTRIKQAESQSDIKPDEKSLTKIADLRAQLNTAKDELNRYLFAQNILPTFKPSDITIPKSIAGTPLEGIVVNKLSVSKQLATEGGFDVVFEMCAGNQIVRVPSVQITSDLESKVVRLADKISPNSCQLSGGKILSSSADSIEVTAGESIKKSLTATNLEQKIADLTKELQAAKKALNDLTHLAPRPADFNVQAYEVTQKIIQIRNEITATKAQLYNFLIQIYQ